MKSEETEKHKSSSSTMRKQRRWHMTRKKHFHARYTPKQNVEWFCEDRRIDQQIHHEIMPRI